MKIIASSKIDFNYIEGIMLVLTKLGHDCIFWNDKKKPLFNMLDEQKPDILFLTPNEQKYLQIGKQEKKIKIVFIGIEESSIEPDIWIDPHPYANTIKYCHRKESKTGYIYDLVYFSDTPISLKQFSILETVSKSKLKIGIFGNIRLPLYEYIGVPLRSERTLLIHNCEAGIDFFGTSFLDFALFGKFCFTFFDNPIFFPVKTIKEICLEIQPLKVETPKQYIYDHRLTDCHVSSDIFDKLGYKEISNQCLNLLV